MRHLLTKVLLGSGLLLWTVALSGQCGTNCTIACNGQINVSLGKDCSTVFTPSMGAKGITPANEMCYSAQVFNHYNYPIVDNLLTMDYVGQELTYKVKEDLCGTHCWGTVLVEYKLGPQIVCPEDITVSCAAYDQLDIAKPDSICAAVSLNLTGENLVELPCDPLHSAKLVKTYEAIDEYGNRNNCSQNIYLKRLELDEIIFPSTTIISCEDPHVQFDADGFPIPWFYDALNDTYSHYGVPFVCQSDVSSGYDCPATGVYGFIPGMLTQVYSPPTDTSYSGLPLYPDDGGIGIVETNDTLHPYDVIDFDNANTSFYCGAAVSYTDREIPRSKTNCTRKIMRTWVVREWWCGEEYEVSSVQTIEITDNTAPTLTCPNDLTVSSQIGCYADINLPTAWVVDDCSPDIDVSIYYDDKELNSNGGIASLTKGRTDLLYVAVDGCDNADSCQTTLTILDYSPPIVLCENGKVISLGNDAYTKVPASVFDKDSYDNCDIDSLQIRRLDGLCHVSAGQWSEFAYFCCEDLASSDIALELRAVDSNGNYGVCELTVVVQDKSIPLISCPADKTVSCEVGYDETNMGHIFGYPYMDDNCQDLTPVEHIVTESQCVFGGMTRVIQLVDPDGGVLNECRQEITILNDNPFTADDIMWPEDFAVSDRCSLDSIAPEYLEELYGFPRVHPDRCASIGFEYSDEVFNYGGDRGKCAIVSRTWNVLNWCGPNGDYEIFTIPFPQLIKLENSVAPVLDDNVDVLVESFNDCDNGYLSVERTAADDCDVSLRWKYTVLDSLQQDTLSEGNTSLAEAKLAVGVYYIYWTVTDRCGNSAFDTQRVTVVSRKAPSAVCLNGLAVKLNSMDTDGDGNIDAEMATLWASDFNGGSYPSCSDDLLYSFSSDVTDRSRIFTCDDLGTQNIQLWVTDAFSGAQDFCIGTLDVQDSGNCSPEEGGITVSGRITTISGKKVDNVDVKLEGSSEISSTNLQGDYAFPNMPLGGAYVVSPSYDTDYLEGVSTIDLIRIQRHVLGIERLDSPYKIIAADINGSNSVNGVDLVELRKLILGVYDNLPQMDSWRFVPENYSFINANNPLTENFEEEYFIPSLDRNRQIDFIGIKVGDVDGSYTSAQGSLDSRNSNPLLFDIDYTKASNGNLVVDLTPVQQHALLGMQGGLMYNTEFFDLVDMRVDGWQFGQDNYHSDLTSGLISFSFHTEVPHVITPESGLVELEFVVSENADTQDLGLRFSSELIDVMAIDGAYQTMDVRLKSKDTSNDMEVSIMPNPWSDQTTIVLQAEQSEAVTLEMYDTSGQLLFSDNVAASPGPNSYTLTRSQINVSGLVYLKITTENSVSGYRMMIH